MSVYTTSAQPLAMDGSAAVLLALIAALVSAGACSREVEKRHDYEEANIDSPREPCPPSSQVRVRACIYIL